MTARIENKPQILTSVEVYKPTVHLEPIVQSIESRRDWFRWINDPEISKWMYSNEAISMPEIYGWIDVATRDPKRHYYTIVADGKSVGFINLRVDQKPDNTAEVGIVIGEKDYWDKGVGSQALKKTLEKAKNEHNLSSVRAMIKPHNDRSIRLFTHAGFNEVERQTIDGVPMIRFEKRLIG